MEKEKFHWVDESVVLNFDMPEHVKNELFELEEMDLKGDACYLFLAPKLEDNLHEEVISGCLTPGQVMKIVERYSGEKMYKWEEENDHL